MVIESNAAISRRTSSTISIEGLPRVYAKPSVFADRTRKAGRGLRTFKLIELAFRELLQTRPFSEISVIQVADASGVARSTVYRNWAGLDGLLWTVARPILQDAIKQAFAGDASAAMRAFEELWAVSGLVPAIGDESASSLIRANIALLVAAEIERRCPERDVDTCALMIASSVVAFLVRFPSRDMLDQSKLQELVFVLYVSAFMTPAALQAAVRHRAKTSDRGRFPPAVSVRESLASDDYILSLIDGRPYRSLARHLSRYGLSPEDYRRCFDLPAEYPLVARSYSARRRELAKAQFGGKRPSARAFEAEAIAANPAEHQAG